MLKGRKREKELDSLADKKKKNLDEGKEFCGEVKAKDARETKNLTNAYVCELYPRTQNK